LYPESPQSVRAASYTPHPPSDAATHDTADPAPRRPEAFISSLLLGQATAVLALTVGVIYAAGELALGLKIYYIKAPWAPVLDGMPKNFILVNAIDDLIPALIAAVPVYYIYGKFATLKKPNGHNKRTRYLLPRQALIVLVGALFTSLVTFLFLQQTKGYFAQGVLRPERQIIIASFAMSVVMMGVGITGLTVLHRRMRSALARQLFGTAIVAVALVPAVASAYAAFPLPGVNLCGPSFAADDAGYHAADGNLIGNSGDWAYIAQFNRNPPKSDNVTSVNIAVVPLPEVKYESITFGDSNVGCGNLANS